MTRELFDSFLDVMKKQADLIDFENMDAEYSNELEENVRRLGLKLSEIYGVQEMKKLIKDWAYIGSFFYYRTPVRKSTERKKYTLSYRKGGINMITLLVLLFLALIAALVVVIFTGLIVVAWPIVLVIAIGLLIDILVLRKIFKSKRS